MPKDWVERAKSRFSGKNKLDGGPVPIGQWMGSVTDVAEKPGPAQPQLRKSTPRKIYKKKVEKK